LPIDFGRKIQYNNSRTVRDSPCRTCDLHGLNGNYPPDTRISNTIYGGNKIMSTTMPNVKEIQRTWYILDAAGKPLGRVAAQAAAILRGKNKPTFAPNVDCGDHVIIINCDQAVLTGKKLEQKYYYWHTGWIGGLKKIQYKDMMENNADRAMYIAVNGMLPNNTLGRAALKRLRVYKGAEHKNAAQKPVPFEF